MISEVRGYKLCLESFQKELGKAAVEENSVHFVCSQY